MPTRNLERRIVALILSGVLILFMSGAPGSAQDYQPQIDQLAEDIAITTTRFGLRNIAVLDFTDLQGNTQELGRLLAEELTTSLVLKERSFKTIDRSNLRSILQEQKLSMTGLQNPSDAKKLKISGVDGLIRGTITRLDEGIRLTLQIITVENGTIIGAARGTIPKTSAMESLVANLDTSSGPSLDGGTSSGSARPGKPFVSLDNNLRVTLKFFRKASENQIKAIFLIEGLKDQSLTIWWHELQIIDDQGAQWRRTETTGLTASETPLSPGASLSALVVFTLDGGASSKATRFNLVGNIEIYRAGTRNDRHYISLSDVRLGI